ncbi:MAG: hypothetical protein ACI92E_002648 [Oceanicoccus sp.]|jgi:hypothetical protein
MNNPSPKIYLSLLKREFWEHRNSFILLPIGLSGLLILVMFIALMLRDNINMDISIDSTDSEKTLVPQEPNQRHFSINFSEGEATIVAEGDAEFASQFNNHKKTLNSGLYGIHGLFLMTAWWVVVFYLLGSLYTDRRDRSILFWKSMPISETQTVLTKLIVGILAVPLIMTVASWLVQIFYVIAAMFFASYLGHDPWETIWPNIDVVSSFFRQINLAIVVSLWLLPLCAWLMAASAFAKRSPFLVATLPIVGIIAIEGIIFRSTYFAEFFSEHFFLEARYTDLIEENSDIGTWLDFGSNLSGVIFAAILLTAAVWLRNHRFEL